MEQDNRKRFHQISEHTQLLKMSTACEVVWCQDGLHSHMKWLNSGGYF